MNAAIRLFSRLLITIGAAHWSLRRIQSGKTPTLTILAYHRVAGSDAPGDPELVSAAPHEFAWQMDYLRRNFTILAFEEISECVKQGKALPSNAAVITFDDGYRDNLEAAAPILHQRGLPAIICLTTGMIGTTARFWWDELFMLLQQTPALTVDLPQLGHLALETPAQRLQARRRLRNLLKAMPETERSTQMAALRGVLGGERLGHSTTANLRPLYLNWDEVRQLLNLGVTFGAHSHTHPILTRLAPAQAETEIATCKRILEAELQRPARFFAYPNGRPEDFDGQIKALLSRFGFEAAVSLIRGGNSLSAPLDWLALRRIYIGGGDDRHSFIVKTSGLLDLLAPEKAAKA